MVDEEPCLCGRQCHDSDSEPLVVSMLRTPILESGRRFEVIGLMKATSSKSVVVDFCC